LFDHPALAAARGTRLCRKESCPTNLRIVIQEGGKLNSESLNSKRLREWIFIDTFV
jgi:hypothetical protein